jgi:hypothetical protein
MPNGLARLVLLMGLVNIFACSQAEPLSITLVNPKTNTVMKCSARQGQGPTATDVSLSGMVELCAKQLEARGFVRVDEKNAAQLINK